MKQNATDSMAASSTGESEQASAHRLMLSELILVLFYERT